MRNTISKDCCVGCIVAENQVRGTEKVKKLALDFLEYLFYI